MPDPEPRIDLAGQAPQQLVAVHALVQHQMRGERGLGRAQSPDVQVMDLLDAGQATEIGGDLALVDARRNGVERQIDRIA